MSNRLADLEVPFEGNHVAELVPPKPKRAHKPRKSKAKAARRFPWESAWLFASGFTAGVTLTLAVILLV